MPHFVMMKDIDDMVDSLYKAIFEACKAALKPRGDSPRWKVAWWNAECYAAVRNAQTTTERTGLHSN